MRGPDRSRSNGWCATLCDLRPGASASGNDAPLPEPGSEIRLQLAETQSVDLAGVTVHDVERVEGEVHVTGGDTLGVFSRWIQTFYGRRYATNGDVFYLPRYQLEQLEQRHLLRGRTVIAAGAAVVAVATIFELAIRSGGGSEAGDSPGGRGFLLVVPIPVGFIR